MMSNSLHKNPKAASRTLFETVIEGGYCIGCGMCAALSGDTSMRMNQHGQWVAERSTSSVPSNSHVAAEAVCPFTDGNPNEDLLAQQLFPQAEEKHAALGRHISCFACYVAQDDYRKNGSSGGLITWILSRLLQDDCIDAVVHVGSSDYQSESGSSIFSFTISRTVDEVRQRSKSRYYPVEMSAVVKHMLEVPGRYAVVGLPCFVKGLRLACRQSEVLNSRVLHTIGIVCGHLKSSGFAEMIGWQLGIPPEGLREIDFRVKCPDAPANRYAVKASGITRKGLVSATAPTSTLFGTNWGYGFFKYKACDFCDDVVGETADISIGDAWLPEYVKDYRGTCVTVVRNPFFQKLIQSGVASGDLVADQISPEQVAASQDAGLRHRREGLAYRLAVAAARGEWVPTKRVAPEKSHLTRKKQRVYSLRTQLAERSHQAFCEAKAAGDFSIFVKRMSPLMKEYNKLYATNVLRRCLMNIIKILRSLISSLKH